MIQPLAEIICINFRQLDCNIRSVICIALWIFSAHIIFLTPLVIRCHDLFPWLKSEANPVPKQRLGKIPGKYDDFVRSCGLLSTH